MDHDKLFELAIHMNDRETRGTDYLMDGKIKLTPKMQESVLCKSIQAFMHKTGVQENETKIIQAFEGSSALPVMTKDVFNVTTKTPNFDLAWQNAFKGIQLKKGQLNWEIADTEESMVFEMIPEGGKLKFYGIKGDKVIVGIQKYGAGLGITWETMEGRKLYQFIDQLELARNKLYKLWADIHYGLIAAGCATNAVAWQGVATDPVLDRDIATINKGYLTIGEATKDSGYGDTANAPMIIYANPNMKARIQMALKATKADITAVRPGSPAGSVGSQTMDYNVTPYYSWNSAVPASKGLMVLPGHKIQNSVYLRELGLSEQEIASLNQLRAYWTAFGATFGDTDQGAELAFA